MTELSLSQVRLRIGALALTALAIAICTGYWALSAPGQPRLLPVDGLLLAIRWLGLPALCLLIGVGLVGNYRALNGNAIDGQTENVSDRFEIYQRYLRNTLEQVVLVIVIWPGLALALPEHAQRLIPALAALFVVGRVSFLAGYLYAPWARAFGFGLTAYPSAIALVWLLLNLF